MVKSFLQYFFYAIWFKAKLSWISCYLRTKAFLKGDNLLVSSYVIPSPWGILNHNFGDDLNKPIIEIISNKKVFFVQQINYNGEENLAAIGSIIGTISTENSIIWGAGFISADSPLSNVPKKICAVRGPLSKQRLDDYNIDCPAIFGDPALLLPCIYSPKKEKKYRYGVVPHMQDYDLPHVKRFRELHPEILFIKLSGYKNWKAVIDEINSCEFVVSSSLHGLIVSDAYAIPNVFVQFSDLLMGGDFKFRDYMAGVNRKYIEPVDLRSTIDLDSLYHLFVSYSPINYDLRPLLRAFPYKLSPRFLEML